MTSFTVSDVLEYLYCPRFTFYEHVQGIPQNQAHRYKVIKGRQIHSDRSERDATYLRKRLGVIDKEQNVYLAQEGFPFRGEVDEVLYFQDGSLAPLDFKYAEYKDHIFETYRTQAVIYGYLLHVIYDRPVEHAYLVFVRSQNKLVTFPLSKNDFESLDQIAEQMEAITANGLLPKATAYKKRCLDCCYQNICPR